MTSDELCDYTASVETRQDFIRFVQELQNDYRDRQSEWENNDLETFLGGLTGFASDMSGYFRNMGEDIDVEKASWRIVAEMLLAATVYGN